MRFITLFSVFTLLLSMPVLAQTNSTSQDSVSDYELLMWQRAQQRYDNDYGNILKRIRKETDGFNNLVRALRSFYPGTTTYDPFSEAIIEEMTRHAYIMDTSKNRDELNKSFVRYQYLLNRHLGNLDVVTFALKMSHVDVRYGNTFFLERYRKALIASMLSGYDGLTPDSAYVVSSYGEETYILAQRGGTLKKSQLYPVNRKYYNVHDVVLDSGEFVQLFFDVTNPIRNIKIKKILNEKGRALNISPQ